jgi:CoA:oxalate CoA-transferase
LCRRLYLTDTEIGGNSTLFHAINRGKESFAANMKDPADLAALKTLISKADVIIQNFRPGIIDRIGLDYETVRKINPHIIYASITGFGSEGPWVDRPGQDLLAQARSGLMWLSGDETQGPVPFGLAIADILAGANVVQGVLSGLLRRGITGEGMHVETSLLESLIDYQFEVLTTYFNDGNRLPVRSSFRNAHAYLSAPYGVYNTRDGFLALAMTPLTKLRDLLGMPELDAFIAVKGSEFKRRDEIKRLLAARLEAETTDHWLAILDPADVWCAKVLKWPDLIASDGFKALDMEQVVTRPDNVRIRTTRVPLRFDGTRPSTQCAAPRIGEQTEAIKTEFGI